MATVHEGKTYNCKQCDFKAKSIGYFYIHVRSVHEGVIYNCEQCDYKASIKAKLKRHVQSDHERYIFVNFVTSSQILKVTSTNIFNLSNTFLKKKNQ